MPDLLLDDVVGRVSRSVPVFLRRTNMRRALVAAVAITVLARRLSPCYKHHPNLQQQHHGRPQRRVDRGHDQPGGCLLQHEHHHSDHG